GAGTQEPGQQVQQGRLAGARRSQQAHDLTGGDVEVDARQGHHVVALEPVDVHQPVGRDVESAHRVPSRIRSTVPPLSWPEATTVARAASSTATTRRVHPPTDTSGRALT